jgi:hypothetical protein
MTTRWLLLLRLEDAQRHGAGVNLTADEVACIIGVAEIRDALSEGWRERAGQQKLADLPGYRICYQPLNGPAPDRELMNRCEPSANPICRTCWCLKDGHGTSTPP